MAARRALRWTVARRKLVAVATALALALAGLISGVVARPGGLAAGPLPRQRTWGVPATHPSVVPARQVIGGISDGHLVFGRQARIPVTVGPAVRGQGGAGARSRGTGPVVLRGSLRPKGAVPSALPRTVPRSRVLGQPALRQLPAPAQGAVAGYSPSSSRLLPSLDAANRVVYENPDGTRTAFFSAGPVSYRLPDGAWAKIDTTLVPGDGTPAPSPATSAGTSMPPAVGSSATGWQVAASGVPEWFAPTAGAPTLVRVGLRGGGWAGFSVAGAANVPGVASGNSVTYSGVFPGVDLRYVAGPSGVAENIVFKARRVPLRWVFPLSLPRGARAVVVTSGDIALVGRSGVVLATVPHGYMTDSHINPRTGDGAYTDRVSYRLAGRPGRPGRQVLVMTLDARWLDSPARVFPVTVDPSVSSQNAGGTTYVQTNDSGDHSGEFEIHAGTYDSGSDEARGLIDFSGVASALENDRVLGAFLDLFETWSWSCDPRPVYVYPVTSSWTPSGTQSWPGPSIGKAIGRASFALGWVPLGSTTSPCPANWEEIPLDQGGTSLINGWTHNSPDDGLALGASGQDNYGWKKFGSINETNGDPKLAITYVPDAATFKLADRRPVTQVTSSQDGKLAVTVTNGGSTTWTPTNGYEMSYVAYNSRGTVVANHPAFTVMPSTVSPGQSVTVNVTIKAMPVGSYTLNLDMYSGATGSNPVAFPYVPPLAVGLTVADPFPVIKYVYPPSGFVSSTVNPQLSAAVYVPSGHGTVTYQFAVTCHPLPGTTCPTNVFGSAAQTKAYWTVTQPLAWNEPYTWTVTIDDDGSATEYGPVSLIPQVPQPVLTSRLGAGAGGAAGGAIDPGSGNFVTSAQDASVAVVTNPNGNTTGYAHDQLGDVITRTDPQVTGQSAPGVWSYTYDADRELLSATDPTGSVTTSTWDYFGDRATSTQQVRTPNGTVNDTTSYSYDYLGDPTQVTSPDGVKATATYNPVGELTAATDAYGNTTSYEYSRLGEPTVVTNPDQTSSQFAYDPAGNLTGTSQWSAPPPPPQTPTQLASQSYGYDASGNMTSQTNSDGHTTTWAYNPAGQVTSQGTPVTSTTSITTRFGYDPAGNQTAYTDGNGNTTWTTYNSRGLPESVIEPPTMAYPSPADGTWTTGYDGDGNPVTQTEPGGVTVTSTYDQLGRLIGQSGTGADAPTTTRTFGYDLAGRLTSAVSRPPSASWRSRRPWRVARRKNSPPNSPVPLSRSRGQPISTTPATSMTSYPAECRRGSGRESAGTWPDSRVGLLGWLALHSGREAWAAGSYAAVGHADLLVQETSAAVAIQRVPAFRAAGCLRRCAGRDDAEQPV